MGLHKLIFVTCLMLVASVISQKASYDNYKVYRIIPTSGEQLAALKKLQDFNDNYSYWREPSIVNRSADLMVGPTKQSEFADLMNLVGIKYETYVDNVQRLVDEERSTVLESPKEFGWENYYDLEEIYAWLKSLAAKYPKQVEVVVGGKTFQGRQIKGIKLSFGGNRSAVFIEGGIHAREWITPATVTYLINEFLTSKQPEIRKLAEAYDWYMFPSDRLWRKTLSDRGYGCKGADPNRNFDYKWMTTGASSDPCSETYAGSEAFSEIETKTLSKYIESISKKLFAYISFHSYSQLLMFPYGHTSEHLDNYEESLSMGRKAVEALAKKYGTQYDTGNIAETIYETSGVSMDWAKGTLKLPVTFTYELRDTGEYGFILPADQIIPNCEEVVDSLIALFEEARRLGYP
ncbi:hypothetical protein QAD02_015091 [Eretmocerus hayati]|uniref:Uncharacterized protein n=1 Tax=Eretmocerus hayati TaxID=131215 RepID=A0ACC2P7Q0_9HYME|nr:hypothetical protein QAD02_015091 [Eretmocerus hayati]